MTENIPDTNIGNNEYIRKDDAVGAVEFGITLASAINIVTGERTELFQRENDELRDAVKRIEALPAADVVPVVRCEDCKHHSFDAGYGNHWCNLTRGVRKVKPDDFCSYGERKE